MGKKEEEKVIINERVDGMLKEFEELLRKAIPVKQNAELVNQIIYSGIKDETKEKVIEELLEVSKEAIKWSNQETTENSEQNTTQQKN